MKKIKIIFLDIDGVLNSNRYYVELDAKGELHKDRDEFGGGFCSKSTKWLNKLIDETGAKIVIPSTWRMSGEKEMKALWKKRKMSGKIIGITPRFDSILGTPTYPRGVEIQWYYEEKHGFRHHYYCFQEEEQSNCMLESYVIIDDDCDMLYEQRDNFVRCDNLQGFLEEEYKQGLKILNA